MGSHNSKLSVIGNKWMLPMSLQDATARAEDYTKYNTGTQFNVAVNYGGRYDILQACKSIAKKTKEGVLQVNEISEQIFEQELETKCVTEFSNPDLLIRTSGELRISNFLLWQLAYTELYFVEKKFHDFGEADFIEALRTYEKRRKRYGGH